MKKKLIFFLATLYTTVAYCQDERRSVYFTAGANICNIDNYTYANPPTNGSKNSYPAGYYMSMLYDVPLSKKSNCASYFTFGLAIDVRRFEHQINYDWDSGFASGSFSSILNMTVNMRTSFINVGIPIMFKQTFDNGRAYINIGLVLNWVSTDVTGQYSDLGQTNFITVYDNTPVPINGPDMSANSLSIDAKISFGYFFNKHFGGEISVQRGLTDVYVNPSESGDQNFSDMEGGRFTVYSLGLVYQLYKRSGVSK